MKTVLTICLLLISGLSAVAQFRTTNTISYADVRRYEEIDGLFETRRLLLMSDSSTRRVDAQLLDAGVSLPAKVNIVLIGNKNTISFALLQEIQTIEILGRIEKLKEELVDLEYVGIDIQSALCYATFKEDVGERSIEKLVAVFGYDGYYISNRDRQIEVFLR